jgi:replication-associated recombination protein RarA
MKTSKGIVKGQVGLDGEKLREAVDEDVNTDDVGLLKSALQKYVRRGNVVKAMWFASKLLDVGGAWSTWKRLLTIAVEDCGQPDAILTCDCLYKMFMATRKQETDQKAVTWDMRRSVVCAAKLLADSPKDRRADSFLEFREATLKCGDDAEVAAKAKELDEMEDFVFDIHTRKGRQMGRGNEYWYDVSSHVENAVQGELEWEKEYVTILSRLAKEKRVSW